MFQLHQFLSAFAQSGEYIFGLFSLFHRAYTEFWEWTQWGITTLSDWTDGHTPLGKRRPLTHSAGNQFSVFFSSQFISLIKHSLWSPAPEHLNRFPSIRWPKPPLSWSPPCLGGFHLIIFCCHTIGQLDTCWGNHELWLQSLLGMFTLGTQFSECWKQGTVPSVSRCTTAPRMHPWATARAPESPDEQSHENRTRDGSWSPILK